MNQTDTRRLENRLILVVDDDPDILATVQQALRSEGAQTLSARDGNQAVHLAESKHPELVVLDMMLPRRSGFLVLERLKQQESPPRVIMITANEGKRHQTYAQSPGVDAYLHKPMRLERLIQRAQDMLSEETAS